VRDAVGVAQNFHRRFAARQTDLAFRLRQRAAQMQERTGREREQENDSQ